MSPSALEATLEQKPQGLHGVLKGWESGFCKWREAEWGPSLVCPQERLCLTSGRGPARVTQLPSSAKRNCSLSHGGWQYFRLGRPAVGFSCLLDGKGGAGVDSIYIWSLPWALKTNKQTNKQRPGKKF